MSSLMKSSGRLEIMSGERSWEEGYASIRA